VDQLRIVVGFKVTPDYEALRPADWVRAAADGPAGGGAGRGPETRYVRRVVNVFDEAALELALRLRDARTAAGLETTLAAFSVAGREAEPFLRTLQALGYEATRVEPGADLDFAPAAAAALVAACTERLGGDVLLLGSRSGPGDSGVVPFLAAEALGRPCLSQVTEVELARSRRLRVSFTADAGPVRTTVTPPCVLAVGNAVVSMLRAPTWYT
jgi:electron transfer flavoprotein beta subunit